MKRYIYTIDPAVQAYGIKIIPVVRLESSYIISRAGVYFSFRKFPVGVVLKRDNKGQYYPVHNDTSFEEVLKELPHLAVLLSE